MPVVCLKNPLCAFLHRRVPVDDAEWQKAHDEYCQSGIPVNAYKHCAIYKVMDIVGFLKTPRDLTPYQTNRVEELTQR